MTTIPTPVAKRVAPSGFYPDAVERAAVKLLREIHRAHEAEPGRIGLSGDPFRAASTILLHVGHHLYYGYPEPLGGEREPKRRSHVPQPTARKVWDRDGWQCVHCGDHRDLTVDHIIPVSKGGQDTDETLENYQTLCRSCNSRKGNR